VTTSSLLVRLPGCCFFIFTRFVEKGGSGTGQAVEATLVLSCLQPPVAHATVRGADGQRNLEGRETLAYLTLCRQDGAALFDDTVLI